jgi:plastocyanin
VTFIKRDLPLVSVSVGAAVLLAGMLYSVAAVQDRGSQEVSGTVAGRVLFGGATAPEGIIASDAIVYLLGDVLTDGNPTGDMPAPAMDQYDYTFVPHVLPLLAGTRLTFTNSDTETHNVHTRSKGRRRNRNFNRAQKPGSIMSTVFANPDSIRVACDIHSQMFAHILVLPNPFFTMAAEDGTFTIAGIPAGSHELLVWHEEYGTVKSVVEIRAGQTTTVEMTLPIGFPGAHK